MPDNTTSKTSRSDTRRVSRDIIFPIRISQTEKETLEAEARSSGFASIADLVRDRLFRQSSDNDIRGHQRVDGGLLTEKQNGELAVATLHLYRINEQAFEQAGGKENFDEGRRRAIEELGLGKLIGS